MHFYINKNIKVLYYLFVICILSIASFSYAEIPSKITGIYLPPKNIHQRRLIEFKHYSNYTNMNAVVLHMKEPTGQIYWNSNNKIAKEIEAVSANSYILKDLEYLKSNNIWSIAKIDVFIDHKLAQKKPEYGIRNSKTGTLWVDFSGLNWTNPYDSRVWDYNIDLCRELAAAGFDEIQFDYVRFPSDGNLKLLGFPLKQKGLTRSKCISRFLEKAYVELKPLGVYISVDVFGLTAWKKTDFGVGQVIEDIAPYVDIICPMFYPSHFPKGFLGLKEPSNYPGKIMYQSIMMLKKRTDKKIRPWVQGFWYSSTEISLQFQAINDAGIDDWMVWNSSGNYEKTNQALIKKELYDFIQPPRFYPSLEELRKKTEKTIKGEKTIVNYTNYQKGFSILSLEKSVKTKKGKFSTPTLVVHSMDEAILDILLIKNKLASKKLSGKYVKSIRIANILCRQINRNPRKISPRPIYVNWGGDGKFSLTIPSE